MKISEQFKLRKATPKVQVQCPNCKGYKTMGDSKKSHTMMMGSAFFFLGVILNLFFLVIIGIPLMAVGFIIMAIAHNLMKEDGSMECRNCKFKFRADVMH